MADASGQFAHARSLFETVATAFREIGETRWLVLSLAHLAVMNSILGDSPRAMEMCKEGLALAETTGDLRGAAVVRLSSAYECVLRGDDGAAVSLIEHALEGFRSVGDAYGAATCLAGRAGVELRRKEIDAAAASLCESLELSDSIGDKRSAAANLHVAAALTLARGDPDAGARLAGAAAKARGTFGLVEPLDEPLVTGTTAALRKALGDRFEGEWATGARTDLADAVNLALEALAR